MLGPVRQPGRRRAQVDGRARSGVPRGGRGPRRRRRDVRAVRDARARPRLPRRPGRRARVVSQGGGGPATARDGQPRRLLCDRAAGSSAIRHERVEWYERAAQLGHGRSAATLGTMYATRRRGRGGARAGAPAGSAPPRTSASIGATWPRRSGSTSRRGTTRSPGRWASIDPRAGIDASFPVAGRRARSASEALSRQSVLSWPRIAVAVGEYRDSEERQWDLGEHDDADAAKMCRRHVIRGARRYVFHRTYDFSPPRRPQARISEDCDVGRPPSARACHAEARWQSVATMDVPARSCCP